MKTVHLLFPVVRGLAVAGLAAGFLAAALTSAPAVLAAPAVSQKPAASQPVANVPLAKAPAAAASVAAAAPVAAAVTATTGCATTYVVQSGDSLWKIGVKYGVEWPQIATKNSLANPSLIYAGQALCLPEAGTTVVTSTVTTSVTVPSGIPTIEVVSVAADQSVTIQASNFPAGKRVDVRLGKDGTLGVGGTLVKTVDAGTGVFTGTYTIPAELKGQPVIAIRLESQWGGYYSYGWFYNTTTK